MMIDVWICCVCTAAFRYQFWVFFFFFFFFGRSQLFFGSKMKIARLDLISLSFSWNCKFIWFINWCGSQFTNLLWHFRDVDSNSMTCLFVVSFLFLTYLFVCEFLSHFILSPLECKSPEPITYNVHYAHAPRKAKFNHITHQFKSIVHQPF